MLGLQFGQNLARAVGRAVVDADQFDLQRNREHLPDHLAQRGAFVVDRHHDGELHGAPSDG